MIFSTTMTETYTTYSVYGMNISSSIPLPDLPQTDLPSNVSMQFGNVTDALINSALHKSETFENPGVKIRASKRAMYFDWDRLGKVFVREGREVIVQPEAETLEEDLHPFLTGPVLAVLLHQRGFFVLHSSAVEINGTTVAFLGAKGFGKSTLAGYLKSKGHRLISDDIVPVNFTKDEVLIYPGFPRIKLYDDAIEAIGQKPANFPRIHRFVEKRSFQCPDSFSLNPIPLNAVYILNENKNVSVEEISQADAFIEVSKNTHLNRFLEALNCQSEYFKYCQKLIQKIPVFRLNRPQDFSKMEDVVSLLENHALKVRQNSAMGIVA